MPSHEKHVIFFAVSSVTEPNTDKKSRYPTQIPIRESESVRCIFYVIVISPELWFFYIIEE